MAKRTEEKPFRPLESSLVHEVMHGNAAAVRQESPREEVKTIELRRPQESERPPEREELPMYQPPPPQPARPLARRVSASPQPSVLGERMDREKRVLLTATEDRALERVVAGIGAELGTTLKLSHVLRSAIRLLINAEDELLDRARANGRTIRPPNGDMAAIEAFEKVVANVLVSGLRSSRPIR